MFQAISLDQGTGKHVDDNENGSEAKGVTVSIITSGFRMSFFQLIQTEIENLDSFHHVFVRNYSN
jgi:hypothetical protein